jgi:hypothetical protein
MSKTWLQEYPKPFSLVPLRFDIMTKNRFGVIFDAPPTFEDYHCT